MTNTCFRQYWDFLIQCLRVFDKFLWTYIGWQFSVRNLSLGRRHLVNAYEVKAGMV